MRLFLHEVRTEQRLSWRNREAAFFTFGLPVILFVIFCAVYGNDHIKKEHDIKASAFLEAGMIGYGLAATCFAGLGITLVVRRSRGSSSGSARHRFPRPRSWPPFSPRPSS